MKHMYHEGGFEDRRRGKFAVVAFLPPFLDAVIKPLRERYDPIYNLITSHITVTFPFETEQPIEEITPIVQAVIGQTAAMRITLNSIGDFYPDYPIIYWSVTENAALHHLYYQLYAALDQPIPFKQYVPHVTIGREISTHRLLLVKDKICSYLPSEGFVAKNLDLITPLAAGGRWVSVRRFQLPE